MGDQPLQCWKHRERGRVVCSGEVGRMQEDHGGAGEEEEEAAERSIW